jgi:MFS family permease
MPGIALPMLGLDRLGKFGWASPEPWALLATGIGLLVLWVRHERKHPDPLVDLTQFRSRPIVAAYLAMMASYIGPALFAIIVLPLLTQPTWTVVGLGLTATAAAMLKIPANILCAFAGSLNGFLTGRFGTSRVAATGAFVLMLTCIGLIFRHDSVWLIGFAMIFGFAIPLVVMWSALTTTIITLSPPEKATEAAGVLQVAKSLGYAIGAQTIAMLLSTSSITQGASTFPSEQAYVLAFGFCGFLAVVAMIMALSVGRLPAVFGPGV